MAEEKRTDDDYIITKNGKKVHKNSLKNLNNVGREQTPEERKEGASRAGKASAVARRRRRELRAIMEDVGTQPMKGGKDLDDYFSFDEMKKRNLTADEMVVFAQYNKAINKGDTRAAEFIRDTLGQKPTDKHEVTENVKMDAFQNLLNQLKDNDDDLE